MTAIRFWAATVVSSAVVSVVSAGVVVNEVMYHAPADLDELQYVELYNSGPDAVDVSGWKLARGVRYQVPAGTQLDAGAFLVVCKDPATFKSQYGVNADGRFDGRLNRSGGSIDLVDARGRRVDSVRYGSRGSWPVAADGLGPSLERICPSASGELPANWAPSPFPSNPMKPGGTPGKANTSFSPRLPPTITDISVTPKHAAPNQEIRVEATVDAPEGVASVDLLYRVARPGSEGGESTVSMQRGANGRYTATIPGQSADRIVRLRVRAVDTQKATRVVPGENDLRPAISVWAHEPYRPENFPFALVVNVGRPAGTSGPGLGRFFGMAPTPVDPPARGNAAYVWVDRKTGTPELFDFVAVSPRSAGQKVRFHKDRPLDGMTTINLIYEYQDRFVLAEPLAFDVYRRAGNAACRTEFARTWIDGRPVGYHLLVEQPNKAFLRHNEQPTDGNMYKLLWYGNGLVGQHEKKTRTREGHADLTKLVDQLNRATGDEQWAVTKANFDVGQVATYFAVNMVLSHWDGFFNNYFTYHDTSKSGKWTMYPWDQDKTWGFHDGIQGYDVFTDMPVTFGMAGDTPPGWPRGRPAPQGFGFATPWWRPGGWFSKPLLANPHFRKVFLARTKDLLDKVYTEEVYFPVIKDLGEKLESEVRYRAQVRREDPNRAVEHLRRNLDALRQHLTKRRAFLLEQDEIKAAVAYDPALWK